MRGTTWEYRIAPIVVENEVALNTLNALGADGWELVAVAEGRAYLKRPAPEFRDRITQTQRNALDTKPGGSPYASQAERQR